MLEADEGFEPSFHSRKLSSLNKKMLDETDSSYAGLPNRVLKEKKANHGKNHRGTRGIRAAATAIQGNVGEPGAFRSQHWLPHSADSPVDAAISTATNSTARRYIGHVVLSAGALA